MLAGPVDRPTTPGDPAMETNRSRLVDYRAKDGVAVIELCNPPMNSLTFEMMHELDEAILRARFDDAVHALVLSAAGERVFCAGIDLRMLRAVAPGFRHAFLLHANETLDRLEHTPKLVIAALHGHAVGGGLELALAADLRIARKGAGRIGLPEVKLGLMPGLGGTRRLARLVNPSRAIELMVTGELMTFEEAHRLGLVNEVWEAASGGDFMEKVLHHARSFGPPQRAAKAVGNIKRAVQGGSGLPAEARHQAELHLG
jgi:enoyl-CoA hydratase